MNPTRTPDKIMADFDAACCGQSDLDPREILWEVISDILDSVDLAVRCYTDPAYPSDSDDLNIEITDTVRDYVGNHYGDL